ncbi:MAG TPA: TolC family protein [Pseudomonadales bacterium]|nr:TolC family protein [Pseudomonadales bacterium]
MQRFLLALYGLAFLSLMVGAGRSLANDTTLSLPQAVQATLQHNPDLGTFIYQHKALASEKTSAALKPAYRVMADLENVAGSGDMRGLDAAEFTLSLASLLEPLEQRQARLAWADASQQRLVSEQRVKTLDVLAALTQDYIEVLAEQDQLHLRESAQGLAEDTVKILTQQASVGKAPPAELLRAKAALAKARLDSKRLLQQGALKRKALALYWGETSPTFTRVTGNLLDLPAAASLPLLQKQLRQNPDLEQLNAAISVRDAELRKAQSLGQASWEWRAGLRQYQNTDDVALVMGISRPLGAKNRAQGAIGTASAQRDEALYVRENAELKLQAKLAQLYQSYQDARQEVQSMQTDVLPVLQEANRETRRAFEYGRYGYLELQGAQTDLLSAQQALLDAAVRAQYLRIAIERLIATDLSALRGENK